MWVVKGGNTSELGDTGMGPGESFLFFLTGLRTLEFWIAQSEGRQPGRVPSVWGIWSAHHGP